jgi:hypothetical protein
MKRSCIITLGLFGALAGCGGGGGGGGGGAGGGAGGGVGGSMPQAQNLEAVPAPQEPFNIPSTTLTATSGGNSYTAIYSQTPNNGTTMFDGQAAYSSTISLTIAENGSTIATEVSTAYYLESPYVPLGLSGTVNGTAYTFLFTSTNPYPSTLTVGSSGPLGSGTYYLSGTNDAVGSLTETYSVTALNSTYLLVTTYGSGTVNGSSVNETITYAVKSAGTVALDSVQLTVNGTALTLAPGGGDWDY